MIQKVPDRQHIADCPIPGSHDLQSKHSVMGQPPALQRFRQAKTESPTLTETALNNAVMGGAFDKLQNAPMIQQGMPDADGMSERLPGQMESAAQRP